LVRIRFHRAYQLARVPDYAAWLARFETALRGLPDKQLGVL